MGQCALTGQRITLDYPLVFDIENDPKELWNINSFSEWAARSMGKILGAYEKALQQFPNLKTGQLETGKP